MRIPAISLRSIAVQSGEVILVLGLVSIFFLFILKFIHFVFPTSSVGLQGLLESQRALVSDEPQSQSRRLSLEQGESELEASAAVLVKMKNAVNRKGADEIAWQSASRGMPLYNRDAVQTHDRSNAEIMFHNNDMLRVGENSLVIIQETTGNPFLNEKRSILALIDGELWGRVSTGKSKKGKSAEYAVNLRGGGIATFREDPNSKSGTEFRIKVDAATQATTVMMYKGVAEVAKAGKSVTVNPNQSARIEKDEPPMAPRPLPETVSLRLPLAKAKFLYSSSQPAIVFSWEKVPHANKYQITIARDSDFSDVVDESLVTNNSYEKSDLVQGTYFWRVQSREHDTLGQYSASREFSLVKDDTPPKLIVNFPPKIVTESRYMLSGITDPDAEVLIDGVKTTVDASGHFNRELELKPGINILVIEAADKVGNSTYKSERIFFKKG